MADTSGMTEYPDVTDWGRIDPERRGRWGRWLYAMRWRRNRMTQDTVRELFRSVEGTGPSGFAEVKVG